MKIFFVVLLTVSVACQGMENVDTPSAQPKALAMVDLGDQREKVLISMGVANKAEKSIIERLKEKVCMQRDTSSASPGCKIECCRPGYWDDNKHCEDCCPYLGCVCLGVVAVGGIAACAVLFR